MIIREAILEVMREKGEPMTADEAYDQIIARGLYNFGASDPKGVVRFTIRRQCEGVDIQASMETKAFRLLEGGLYEPIAERPDVPADEPSDPEPEDTVRDQLASLGNEHKEQFVEEVIAFLKQIPWEDFEVFSRDLLEDYGLVDVEVTSSGADGGIDGHGKWPLGLTTLNVSFQCKRWGKPVGLSDVDRFRGAIAGKNIHLGIFLTTSYFTKEAKKKREPAEPVILLGGREIVEIMLNNKFKVRESPIPLYELDFS